VFDDTTFYEAVHLLEYGQEIVFPGIGFDGMDTAFPKEVRFPGGPVELV
jgi:hypothetical protein